MDLLLETGSPLENKKNRSSSISFAEMLDEAPIGIHCVDAKGNIQWANRTQLNMLGYEPDEYIGHPVAKFHVNTAVLDSMMQQLQRGQSIESREVRLWHKDGSMRIGAVSSNAVWEDGKFIHTRCFTLDVTERRRVEQALRQAEKMAAVGRLAATVAHEINNPLETVTNLLYLAKIAKTLPESKNCVAEAQNEMRRIAHLTKQTLGFFKDTVAPRRCDLSKLIAELLGVYKSKLSSKNVRTETA